MAAFKIFAQSRVPQRLLPSSPDHAGEGFFFGLFPRSKKSENKSALGAGTECGLFSIHAERSSNGSERSAFGARTSALRWSMTMGMRGCVWTLRGARIGRTWTRGTHSGARLGSTEVPQIQFIDFVVIEAELEYIIMCQSTEAFGSFTVPCVCSRCSHMENGALFLYNLVSGSLSRCLGAACGLRDIGFFGR